MPYEIHFETEGVYVRFYGVVALDDLQGANTELWSSPHWDDVRYEIVDSRDVTSHAVSEADVLAIAHMDNAAFLTSQRKKMALVASNPSIRRLCEGYAATAASWEWEAKIFDTLDAAREWAEA